MPEANLSTLAADRLLASAARVMRRARLGRSSCVWLDADGVATVRYEETAGGERSVVVARDGRDVASRSLPHRDEVRRSLRNRA